MTTFPTGTDPGPILADTQRVIADIVKDGVSPDLVAASRRLEQAQLAFNSNSIDGLADNWSRALTLEGAQSPDDVAKAYAAVTVDDVNRLARTLLDPTHAITAILTPREAGSPVAGGGFGGTESLARLPDHPVELPSWASAATTIPPVPELGKPAFDEVLPNGLRLIVQPEHISPTVTVYGRVRQVAAMQEPAGKEGVATLMHRLFDYGTEAHDRIAYREAIDNIAAQTSTGTSFSLQVLAPEFADGMRLLAENELHPAFPTDSFAIVRNQLAQMIAGQLHTPDYQYRLAFYRALVPEGDPTLRQPTSDTVMSVQPDDLRAYFAATMRPDLTTIVVIGDVTVEQARKVADETFGRWQAVGKTPAIELPPIGPNKPSYTRITDDGAQQDTLSLAETIGLPLTNSDRYTLALGNVVLGDGFSSRLYQDLRVRSGIVYSVRSGLQWEPTRTYYGLSFGAATENIEKARAMVLRDIKAMQTDSVTDAELARAKAQLLCQLLMARESVADLARGYLRLADLGLPLDDARTAAVRYHAITASDIRRAFAAWIRTDDLAQVVTGPPR
jgi:zinc protease